MLGGKDGQTLFHRILPATARGLTSTTSVDWHLKVKNKTCNVGLTKNYCIKVSMQKISSINKLIQQILGSHELHDHAHFWPGPPKSHWNNFLFSWICTTMQKIIFWPTFMWICINMQKIRLLHWFVLEIWLIKKSCNLIGWEHFGPYLRNQNFPKYGICAGT